MRSSAALALEASAAEECGALRRQGLTALACWPIAGRQMCPQMNFLLLRGVWCLLMCFLFSQKHRFNLLSSARREVVVKRALHGEKCFHANS